MFQTAENSTIKNCRVEKLQNKFHKKWLVHTHQQPQSHGWKTMLNITFHRNIGHKNRQICLQLKTCGALCLQLHVYARQSREHWRHSNVVFGNLLHQFLWPLCKISSVWCLADLRQSSETKETQIHPNICALSWRNVVCCHVIVQFVGVATLLSIIIVAGQLSA